MGSDVQDKAWSCYPAGGESLEGHAHDLYFFLMAWPSKALSWGATGPSSHLPGGSCRIQRIRKVDERSWRSIIRPLLPRLLPSRHSAAFFFFY